MPPAPPPPPPSFATLFEPSGHTCPRTPPAEIVPTFPNVPRADEDDPAAGPAAAWATVVARAGTAAPAEQKPCGGEPIRGASGPALRALARIRDATDPAGAAIATPAATAVLELAAL